MLLLAGVFLAKSTLIINATVIDGTGSKPKSASVRLLDGKINAVGNLKPIEGETVVDAKGLVVAPGFIDAHSHALGGIADEPTSLSQLTQGITTAVVGQDGGWSKPVAEEMADLDGIKPSLNFAFFSGHGGLRRRVMGEDYKRVANPMEQGIMRSLLADDMHAGALGLSSGLEYDPGYYSDTAELVSLARVAGEAGGIYISHIRDEADKSFEAFAEVAQIRDQANVRTQISHIKLGTQKVWGRARDVDAFLNQEGVTADVYPYLYWHSTIAALSPSRDWANAAIWVQGLADVGGPQNVRLVGYTHEPTWVGKNLAEISALTGKSAPALIQEILEKTEGPTGSGSQHVVVTAMTEPDLEHFIQHPKIMFCSDGAIGGRHPRGAGSFPRILGRYVRERKTISLSEAIRKMTSLPARTFLLKRRGELKPGFAADVVLFDPNTINDRATPENPTELSVGVNSVWVNGERVLADGKSTGTRSGVVIRRAN
ncbi:MAG: D-aminoacylase [Chthonomonas sp.]|nr:D-aminoacylase [Chthonomonas sp.]